MAMNNFGRIRRKRKVLLECVVASCKCEMESATSLRVCIHLLCFSEHEVTDAYDNERISCIQDVR